MDGGRLKKVMLLARFMQVRVPVTRDTSGTFQYFRSDQLASAGEVGDKVVQ